MKRISALYAVASTTFLILCQGSAYAEVHEYDLKAAFLYNIALFTDWPVETFEDKDSAFTFCIAGSDPFGNSIDSLLVKSLKNRKISIMRQGKTSNFNKCQVLFIPSSESSQAESILREIKNTSTLTVSEDNSAFKKGSMLNLSITENKLRFQVNREAVSASKLSISSKLLRLADSIQKEKE
jgi:YfiR/HmsC-like